MMMEKIPERKGGTMMTNNKNDKQYLIISIYTQEQVHKNLLG